MAHTEFCRLCRLRPAKQTTVINMPREINIKNTPPRNASTFKLPVTNDKRKCFFLYMYKIKNENRAKTLIRLLCERGRRRKWEGGRKKWFYYFENLWLIAVISLNAVFFFRHYFYCCWKVFMPCWIESADARTQLNGNEFRIGQVNKSNREKDNCHIIQSNDGFLLWQWV